MKEETMLELKDIVVAVQVIDIACQRGAIRPEEMADVGIVRNRLVRFLNPLKETEQGTTEDGVEKDAE